MQVFEGVVCNRCYCPHHPDTVLICPRCIASRGGQATAKKYGTKQLATWGSSGGRGKKSESKIPPKKKPRR